MQEQTTIIVRHDTSNADGIASFIFGLISIFIFAPLFVPLAVILGIIAIINRTLVWGTLGLICAAIGFLTSPVLLGLFAITTIASAVPGHTTQTNINSQLNQNQSTAAYRQSYQERLKQVGIEVKAVVDECKNKRLIGDLKTFAASANCSNPRILAAYQNAGYPYMDLIGQLTAKRLEVSEKIDAGQLTEGQAQLETAQFITHLVNIEKQRNSAK